jgi:general secretion pathway protein F
MPRYRYRAYDGSGTLRAGELWVENRQDALQALARKSQIAIELEEAPDAAALPWWQREIGGGSKLSSSALTDFLRELSGLIAANLPIDEALRIMAVQPAIKPSLRKLVADLLDRVTSGAALSEAMSAHQGAFPPFVIRLIHAGEISGGLDGILADLSRYYEQANARASKLAAQLLYPAVLIAAAIIALTVIATVLVPALKPLFEDAGQRASAIDQRTLLDHGNTRDVRRADHSGYSVLRHRRRPPCGSAHRAEWPLTSDSQPSILWRDHPAV